MRYRLGTGLFFALCQDDIILLDLRQDRFFAVPRTLNDCFLRLIVEGEGDEADHASLMKVLGADGLIACENNSASDRSHPPAASCQLHREASSPSLKRSLYAFRLRALSAIILRQGTLEDVVAMLRRRKETTTPPSALAVEPALIAQAFDRAAPFFPIGDHCLPMSVALMMGLLSHQILATLVIGVRAAPFSAHCWVQIDDQLVNDDLDIVRGFTPIMAI